MLYRPKSEYARDVESFAEEFTRIYKDKKIELISVDTKEGSATASIYDILEYPTVLALTDDGQLVRSWQGSTMPLINEVSYYATTA